MLAFISKSEDLPNMSVYRPDYQFQAVIGIWGSYPSKSHASKDLQDALLIKTFPCWIEPVRRFRLLC